MLILRRRPVDEVSCIYKIQLSCDIIGYNIFITKACNMYLPVSIISEQFDNKT